MRRVAADPVSNPGTKVRASFPFLASVCSLVTHVSYFVPLSPLSLRDAQTHLLSALSTFIVDSGDCIRRLSVRISINCDRLCSLLPPGLMRCSFFSCCSQDESMELTDTLNHVLDGWLPRLSIHRVPAFPP